MSRFRRGLAPALSSLFLAALALWAAPSQAQAVRSSASPYVMLRGAATGYSGDLTSDGLVDAFDDTGVGVGAEAGYLLSESLSLGLAGWYHNVPSLDAGGTQGADAGQVQVLARYLPFSGARLAPYAEFGGALVLGQGDDPGFGPVVGLGVDVALTPRLGLLLGAQSTLVFPDGALDNADPGAAGLPDETDFDVLTSLGGGLRFAFRGPVSPLSIEGLECPATLDVGEPGTFTVVTAPDGASATWQWGDGTSGAGATATKAYANPGTYTVSALARDAGGTDSESCLVTVTEPPVAPALAACRATPATVAPGDAVLIEASVSDADAVTVDFGDGATAGALPARTAYARAGTYTVRITAQNAYGSDTCAVAVTVATPTDPFCEGIPELNPVFFGFAESTLSPDARARLAENASLLDRCQSLCVTVVAYTDDQEPNAFQLAQRRAEAVRQAYAEAGVAGDRVRAVGRGVSPDSNSKEDPGRGDARARRADSIPSSCDGF